MAVTIHDVADAAGVSIKTVSNVVNDYQHVRATTRARVQEAIDRLGYVPNLSARQLRSGRSNTIALIIPYLRNAYFAELADTIMRTADAHGLKVIIEQSDGSRTREFDFLEGPGVRTLDGVLFSALGARQADAELLASLPVPTVLLGENILNGPLDHVTMKNTDGVQAATRHLIERGCRRIVALGGSRGQRGGSGVLRMAGYEAALADAGLPFDEELVVHVADWFRGTGYTAMRELIDSGVRFDGVVGFADSITHGALRALQDSGLAVPDDVAIIGFDDIDENLYSLPTLSSIDPGRSEIASVALRFLIDRIGGSTEAPRTHLAEFAVRERQSTARG